MSADLLQEDRNWRTAEEITLLVRSTRLVAVKEFSKFLKETTSNATPTEEGIAECA